MKCDGHELENAHEVVLSYTKDIERVAHKFINERRNYKEFKKELVQQGYLGLLEAREKFDISKNTNGFWSYACNFVTGRMKDFTIHYTNQIRPSQKLNSIMLQIYRNNITHCSPEYIADCLGCTVDMAKQAVDYIRVRTVKSFHQPISHTDISEKLELIDLIPSNVDPNILFQVEVMSELSPLEQGIVRMLIDRYSTKDILRHFKMSKYSLNNTLQKILNACGYDCTDSLNRNGGWLMNLNALDLDEVEEVTVRSRLEWVPLDRVLPNPKNPRRDPSVRTEEMQNTIETIGWEEPITCYESGNNFIILSGHRRWYAAKQLKRVRVPIYIVEAPKSEAEEMDRIGSVQGGQVEWNPFEQVKYTYDRWIASGKMSYHDLGDELGISKGLVGSRIRVYTYYPEDEIEEKLNNRMYSITMLDYIFTWIKRLNKYHPEIVESLGEHYIRRLMLKKYENRCFNSQLANDKTFVRTATSHAIREFLTDANRKLQDCQVELTYFKDDKINYSLIVSEIKNIRAGTKDETEELLLELDKLLICIDKKIYLESKHS